MNVACIRSVVGLQPTDDSLAPHEVALCVPIACYGVRKCTFRIPNVSAIVFPLAQSVIIHRDTNGFNETAELLDLTRYD